MMNCEEVQEYLSDLLDKTLAVDRAQEIKDHLNSCSLCAEEMARLAECQRLVSSLPAVEPPAGFTTRVMAKVREAENPPGLWKRLFLPFQIKIPLPATAVILIAVLAAYVYQKEEPVQRELGVIFEPESSLKKQENAGDLAPSVTQVPSSDAKTKEVAEETRPRGEEFKDSALERKPQLPAKAREQDKDIAGSLQEKSSAASEGGFGRMDQSPPSAEPQGKGVAARTLQPKAENSLKDAPLAGKPLSSSAAPRSAAPSLDSIRPSRGVDVALPVDHELAIRLKDSARDDKSTGDRLASDRAQAERRQLLPQEEANILDQARERAIQTGQSQIVQLTIARNQYELFKKELADLGTLEMESSASEPKDGAIGKSSDHLRIQVTILPPLASQNPAPSQPSSR